MKEANTPPESDAPPVDPIARRSGLLARIWPYLRPHLRQTWVNVKVWAPFFANPFDRERCVRYWARESREGLTWKIALPSRCYSCKATEELLRREYDFTIRAFEYGPAIGLATIGIAAFFFILSVVFLSVTTFLLTLILLLGGGLLMYLKSWQERVRVFISTCRDHADGLTRPDAVVDDNNLHLFLPTPELAQAARVELQAERIRNRPLGGETGGYTPRGPDAGTSHRQDGLGPTVRRAPDLPPIKLSGDDDEEEDEVGLD